jgi:hypothetical protein
MHDLQNSLFGPWKEWLIGHVMKTHDQFSSSWLSRSGPLMCPWWLLVSSNLLCSHSCLGPCAGACHMLPNHIGRSIGRGKCGASEIADTCHVSALKSEALHLSSVSHCHARAGQRAGTSGALKVILKNIFLAKGQGGARRIRYGSTHPRDTLSLPA